MIVTAGADVNVDEKNLITKKKKTPLKLNLISCQTCANKY